MSDSLLQRNDLGPPPRARGIPLRRCAVERDGGSTPAYAGNTVAVDVRCAAAQVHPRVRGEYAKPFDAKAVKGVIAEDVRNRTLSVFG